MGKQTTPEAELLRRKAAEMLNSGTDVAGDLTAADAGIRNLAHEVEILQTQLELRNNELHKVKEQAEEERRKSEEKFRIVADNAFNWEFWEGADGKWIHHSPSCKKLTGYSAGEFLNEAGLILKIIHPEDREAYIKHHGAAKKEKTQGRHFFRIITKEGRTRYIEHVCQVVFNNSGDFIGIRGTNIDITERMMAEDEALQLAGMIVAKERFLANAEAISHHGSWELDLHSGHLTWSDEVYRIFGLEPQELPSTYDAFLATVHPDDREAVDSEYYGSIRDNKDNYQLEHRIVRNKTEEIRWVIEKCEHIRDNSGKIVRSLGSVLDITERKLIEDQLRESEVQYRNLANAGSALIWRSGTDKLCNYFNEPWLKFTGRTLEQEKGNGWAEGVHPDDFDSCLETYVTSFDKREPFEMDYRMRHSSGEYRWILDMGTPNFNSKGDFIGYMGHCFDITERKLAQDTHTFLATCGLPGTGEDFFESLARYLALTLNMEYVCIDRLVGDGLSAQTVAIYNEGRFDSNAQYALKDTPCGEVVDRSICFYRAGVRNLFPKDAALQDLKAESYAGTTLIDSKGKAIGLIAIIGHRPLNEEGRAEALLKLVAPRAAGELERREAENSLKQTLIELNSAKEQTEESERLLATIAENYPNSFVTLIEKDLTVSFSGGQEFTRQNLDPVKFKGLTPEQVYGENAPFVKEYFLKSFAGEETSFELCQKDQFQLYKTVPLNDENGNITRLLVVVENITGRKRGEEKLQNRMAELTNAYKQLDKYISDNKELQQFAYISSHQLQQPIRTISNFIRIIEEDYSDILDNTALAYLTTIKLSAARMNSLILALSDYSQLGQNRKLESVDCEKMVNDVITDLESVIKSSGTSIEVSKMPLLNGYEVELRQVFQNLLSNAIKYQKKDNRPEIKIASEQINGKWQFSVRDNGIGIETDQYQKIFNIFQRLHLDEEEYEGKGIGLAFCKKIVELHQGEIWVESALGQGTTVYFTISNLVL